MAVRKFSIIGCVAFLSVVLCGRSKHMKGSKERYLLGQNATHECCYV